MPRALDDPVGWETITGYLDVLRLLRPRAFLLENVPGLAYDVHQEALNHILAAVREIGYVPEWRVLNAADYGVPQIRQRLFIVGLQAGSFQWPTPRTLRSPRRGSLPGPSGLGWRWRCNQRPRHGTDGGRQRPFRGRTASRPAPASPPGRQLPVLHCRTWPSEPKFKWRSRYWSFLLKLSPDLPS